MSDSKYTLGPAGCLVMVALTPLVAFVRAAALYCTWRWFAWRVIATPPALSFVGAFSVVLILWTLRRPLGAADQEAVKNHDAAMTWTRSAGSALMPLVTIVIGFLVDAILKAVGS